MGGGCRRGGRGEEEGRKRGIEDKTESREGTEEGHWGREKECKPTNPRPQFKVPGTAALTSR